MLIRPSKMLFLEPGDFHGYIHEETLFVPQELYDRVTSYTAPHPPQTDILFCGTLVHWETSLANALGWEQNAFQEARDKLFAQMADAGHPFTTTSGPVRPLGVTTHLHTEDTCGDEVTLILASDPAIQVEPGDFHTRVEGKTLFIPAILMELATQLPRPIKTAQGLCEFLEHAPAHFLARLRRPEPKTWGLPRLMEAQARIVLQLKAAGAWVEPTPDPPARIMGALPPRK